MITHRLVLVLGAGASMPYGFPSGRDLKTAIARNLEPTGDPPMRRQLLEAGFAEELILGFQHDLVRSGMYSVDAFLEHRAEFLRVGKAAIACALMPLERGESFFSDNPQNWYEYLFNKLNARFEEFDKNSVAVLTFNYDRSLEHYLFTTLMNTYGKGSEECAEKLRSLPVIHLYGQLGGLPYLASGGVEFGAILSPENLQRCAEGIRIVHEDVSDEPQFRQAHKLLQNAERVCFLGFGFDPTNLGRLMSYGPNGSQAWYGSAVNITSRECFFIEVRLKKLGLGDHGRLDPNSRDSLDFLRKSCAFDWE